MSSQEIAGRYRLEGRLGYGGMSTVHLAMDLRLERQVAVKLLAEHLADDPAFVSRFQREAQAAARLIHPNIVQVFDSGRDRGSEKYFIVMEYIQGSSCAEILRDLTERKQVQRASCDNYNPIVAGRPRLRLFTSPSNSRISFDLGALRKGYSDELYIA